MIRLKITLPRFHLLTSVVGVVCSGVILGLNFSPTVNLLYYNYNVAVVRYNYGWPWQCYQTEEVFLRDEDALKYRAGVPSAYWYGDPYLGEDVAIDWSTKLATPFICLLILISTCICAERLYNGFYRCQHQIENAMLTKLGASKYSPENDEEKPPQPPPAPK